MVTMEASPGTLIHSPAFLPPLLSSSLPSLPSILPSSSPFSPSSVAIISNSVDSVSHLKKIAKEGGFFPTRTFVTPSGNVYLFAEDKKYIDPKIFSSHGISVVMSRVGFFFAHRSVLPLSSSVHSLIA
jgi:hypothetical protein